MRIFLPVHFFATGAHEAIRSVWTGEEPEFALPYMMERTLTDGTVEQRIFDVEDRDTEAGWVVLTPLVHHEMQGLQIDKWGFERLESPVDDGLFCGDCEGPCELAWDRGEAGGPGRWIDTAAGVSSCCGGELFLDPMLTVPWDPDPNDWGAFEVCDYD